MATRTTSLNSDVSTNAAFTAWVNEVHTAITAFGWVQTADTGQIANPASVNNPGISTDAGFLIYHMNDSLQSTSPFFLKLTFGCGSATTIPRLKAQIGTATNGTGTLTGNFTTEQTTQTTAVAGTGNVYTSGSTSRFQMTAWPTLGNKVHVISIERDRSSLGAEQAFGAHQYFSSPGQTRSQFCPQPASGGVGAVENTSIALLSTQTTQSALSSVGLGAVRAAYGPLRNPGISILLCSRGDFTNETTNTVNIYGANHTYLAVIQANLSGVSLINSAAGIFMLFE